MNCRRHYRPIGDNLRQFDMGRKHIGRQGGELPGDSVKPVKRFNASTSLLYIRGRTPDVRKDCGGGIGRRAGAESRGDYISQV